MKLKTVFFIILLAALVFLVGELRYVFLPQFLANQKAKEQAELQALAASPSPLDSTTPQSSPSARVSMEALKQELADPAVQAIFQKMTAQEKVSQVLMYPVQIASSSSVKSVSGSSPTASAAASSFTQAKRSDPHVQWIMKNGPGFVAVYPTSSSSASSSSSAAPLNASITHFYSFLVQQKFASEEASIRPWLVTVNTANAADSTNAAASVRGNDAATNIQLPTAPNVSLSARYFSADQLLPAQIDWSFLHAEDVLLLDPTLSNRQITLLQKNLLDAYENNPELQQEIDQTVQEILLIKLHYSNQENIPKGAQ